MSRTDRTRPRWVRLADQRMVTAEPLHDHRSGACTLPADVDAASTDPYRTSGCRWVPTAALRAVRTDRGGKEWNQLRRAEQIRDRHQARRRLRENGPDL